MRFARLALQTTATAAGLLAIAAGPVGGQTIQSLSPQINTHIEGSVEGSFLEKTDFESLLATQITSILDELEKRLENPAPNDRALLLDNMILASEYEISWRGCLHWIDEQPTSRGGCLYSFGPQPLTGLASIDTIAGQVAAAVMELRRPTPSFAEIFIGCIPTDDGAKSVEPALLFQATRLSSIVASNYGIRPKIYENPCDNHLNEDQALFDFGIVLSADNGSNTLAPRLSAGSRAAPTLLPVRLPDKFDQALSTLVELSGDLSRLYSEAIVGYLEAKNGAVSDAPQFTAFHAAKKASPLDTARYLRKAGFLQLAQHFLQQGLEQGNASDASHSAYLIERGMLQLEQGLVDEAHADLRKGIGDAKPIDSQNSLEAHRALVDSAYYTLNFNEAVRTGEEVLKVASSSPDVEKIRFRLVQSYNTLALNCIRPNLACPHIAEISTEPKSDKLHPAPELVANAVRDLRRAVELLAEALKSSDPDVTKRALALANFLATSSLSAINIRDVPKTPDPDLLISYNQLLQVIRDSTNLLGDDTNLRRSVLLGRTDLKQALLTIPSPALLESALDHFQVARIQRNTDLREQKDATATHPLLDFEIAEILAIQQQFQEAAANAMLGLEFLDEDIVKKSYESGSWGVLAAFFEQLANQENDMVDQFNSTLASYERMPYVVEKTSTLVANWRYAGFYRYVCDTYQGELRQAALEMLDAIMKKGGEERPYCS